LSVQVETRSKRLIKIGNGATNGDKIVNVDKNPADFLDLITFATDNNVQLLVPGPEQPLVDGIADAFKKGSFEVGVI
jgi:phosphoribosylamine--glycine ligase/phosphoribosylformylglycinamidine cyclo-ligase